MRHREFTLTRRGKEIADLDFRVYPTLKLMRAALARREFRSYPGKENEPLIAACTHKIPRGSRPPREFVLFFNEEHLGAGILAHEVTHAAVYVNRVEVGVIANSRPGLLRASEAHEAIANTVEDLTKAFWNWWLEDKT